MSKVRLLIVLPAVSLLCMGCSNKKIPVPKGYELIWNDEFEGESLDSSKWSYMIGNGAEYGNPGWGNGELQYYTEENTYIKDNQLHIKVKRENKEGFEFTSSRIRTEGKFSFLYGKVEARIALPAGKGMWPAFWMLPEEWKYGGWPDSGEIDIMEANGGSLGGSSAALHYSRVKGQDTYYMGYNSLNLRNGESITDFHLYGLEWEEESIIFLVDNKEILNVPMRGWSTAAVDKSENPYAPFDQKFHFLLNVAVGGNYVNFVNPDADFTESEMVVDYIRVYQYKN